MGELPYAWEDEAAPTHKVTMRKLGFMKDGILAMLRREPVARPYLDDVLHLWRAVLQQTETATATQCGA